jgi:hypothetical protein
MSSLYDTDFVRWSREQAEQLRRARDAGSNLDLDWDNLIEEIEGLARSERRELRSDIKVVLEHLAKLALSPARAPRRGWEASVAEHRDRIGFNLEDNPSLRPELAKLIEQVWPLARRNAAKALQRHRERADPPASCPFTSEQVLDPDWWPGEPG